jgi:TetR/AcrR family transcriptional regulator
MTSENLEPVSSLTALKIVDAAAKLFMQRGYRAVSITDIIKAAEITKPTLYYYFPDKEELFVQMGLRVLSQMGEQLRAAAGRASDLEGQLLGLADVFMGERDGDMRMVRHEMGEHLGPSQRERMGHAFYSQLFAPIYSVMEQGIAEGRLSGHTPASLTTMFLGICESFHEFAPSAQPEHWGQEPSSPFAQVTITARTLVDFFLYGVAGTRKA